MESVLSAVKGGIVPMQEYLLQGSILESSRDVLLHRLRGLCDNLETGPETFHDHEMVYQMSKCQPAAGESALCLVSSDYASITPHFSSAAVSGSML